MQKWTRRKETGIPYIDLLLYLFCAYLVTAGILFMLALFLYHFDLSKEVISTGIILTYVAAGLFAGFLAGKRMKQKKYIWGLFMGVAYYVVLLMLSLLTKHSVYSTESVLTTFILCAGGGMLGGMLS